MKSRKPLTTINGLYTTTGALSLLNGYSREWFRQRCNAGDISPVAYCGRQPLYSLKDIQKLNAKHFAVHSIENILKQRK